MNWERTAKQAEAVRLLAAYNEVMLFGGSRAGKTFILIYCMLVRAIKAPYTRHLILRKHLSHIRTSIWRDTLPKVLSVAFPALVRGVHYDPHEAEMWVGLWNGSEIWLGGLDDGERVEKILGTEYATIYINEASQVDWDSIQTVRTRLAQKCPLRNVMWFDCNPPSKRHWAYGYFVERIDPTTGEKVANPAYAGSMLMNPVDNLDNLPDDYLERLETLPKRQRERFLLGLFTSDTEGALWSYEDIEGAKARPRCAPRTTIIAVDPAVTANSTSDETGIVVMTADDEDGATVEADLSIRAKADIWASQVVRAYHEYEADAVVAEVNQGGDLVELAIKQIDRSVNVRTVRASKGKFARAEPVQALYAQGKITHAPGLDELEDQMLTWVPNQSKGSPDRIDALVWGAFDLLLDRAPEPGIRYL